MPRTIGKQRNGGGAGQVLEMATLFRLTNKLAEREFSHPLSEYWLGLAISQELLTIKMRLLKQRIRELNRAR